MSILNHQDDELLAALRLPLRNVAVDAVMAPEETMGAGKIFGEGDCRSESRSISPRIECGFLDLGGLTVLSGRTTPIHG